MVCDQIRLKYDYPASETSQHIVNIYLNLTGIVIRGWRREIFVFVRFDSLSPINNLSVIRGRVFLG